MKHRNIKAGQTWEFCWADYDIERLLITKIENRIAYFSDGTNEPLTRLQCHNSFRLVSEYDVTNKNIYDILMVMLNAE